MIGEAPVMLLAHEAIPNWARDIDQLRVSAGPRRGDFSRHSPDTSSHLRPVEESSLGMHEVATVTGTANMVGSDVRSSRSKQGDVWGSAVAVAEAHQSHKVSL